jgi:hypothetical protein
MPEQPTILEEAQFLTRGNRNSDYGHPLDDYIRTAKIWSAILGIEITAEQAMLCMIGVKLSRQCHRPKRDNLVDICGYADCVDRAMEERERRLQTWTGSTEDVDLEMDTNTVQNENR